MDERITPMTMNRYMRAVPIALHNIPVHRTVLISTQLNFET